MLSYRVKYNNGARTSGRDNTPERNEDERSNEISRTIDKLKSIVQKNDQFGIRRRSGKRTVLIASNTEMTMQLSSEALKARKLHHSYESLDALKSSGWRSRLLMQTAKTLLRSRQKL